MMETNQIKVTGYYTQGSNLQKYINYTYADYVTFMDSLGQFIYNGCHFTVLYIEDSEKKAEYKNLKLLEICKEFYMYHYERLKLKLIIKERNYDKYHSEQIEREVVNLIQSKIKQHENNVNDRTKK